MICSILINNKLLANGRLYRGAIWTFLALLLLSVYGRWLIDATPEPLRPAWWIFGPFILLTDILNPVFFDRMWFFLFCICGLSMCVLFWDTGRGGWRLRAVSATFLGLIIAAPFAVMFMYGPYSLRSVSVAPGYELNWLTQPKGNFASAFKSAQREHDVYGCRYLLHGWGRDNRLYYGSYCGSSLWLYDPQTGEKPPRIQHLPVDSGTLAPVPPTGHTRLNGEGGLRVSRVVEEAMSPDGRFKAAVIQDSFYGPYDVLVMQRAAPE